MREAFAAAGGAGCPVDVVVRTDEAPAKMDFQELVDEMRKVIEGSCDR